MESSPNSARKPISPNCPMSMTHRPSVTLISLPVRGRKPGCDQSGPIRTAAVQKLGGVVCLHYRTDTPGIWLAHCRSIWRIRQSTLLGPNQTSAIADTPTIWLLKWWPLEIVFLAYRKRQARTPKIRRSTPPSFCKGENNSKNGGRDRGLQRAGLHPDAPQGGSSQDTRHQKKRSEQPVTHEHHWPKAAVTNGLDEI